MNNRPRSREKNVTSGGGNAFERTSSRSSLPIGGKKSLPAILMVVLAMILGGGGFSLSSLLGGTQPTYTDSSSTTSWSQGDADMSSINTNVDPASRSKYANIIGGGQDQVTVMVYMCGSDLESRSGMATKDLQEMANATLSNKVRLLVYTGGASRWQNNVVSSSTNQIYEVKNGQFSRVVDNDGNRAMSDPATLTRFIKYASTNYEANRYQLIFWDHGGGSVSGFGYDEKHQRPAMNLAEIDSALTNANVKFDFIGFDACLMATVENAQMLSKHADYLIGSEETEPGTGWYYTNWLTRLSTNSSTTTLNIGKMIADDYMSHNKGNYNTTLSIVDLSELSKTLTSPFNNFAKSINSMMQTDKKTDVMNARMKSREFAQANRIDQIDLSDFAGRINNDEGSKLSSVIKSAIKYNRTNMMNAYGLSIFFPQSRTNKIDSMVDTYSKIGVSDEYSKAIQNAGTLVSAGQSVQGGDSGSFGQLLQSLAGNETSSQLAMQMLTQMLSGQNLNISGLSNRNTKFIRESTLSKDNLTQYVKSHQLDNKKLNWVNEDGKKKLKLSESEWKMIQKVDLNIFYKYNNGYFNLGEDNIFKFDNDGNMIADEDGTWLAINGQVVPYYHVSTQEKDDDYTIIGYVPCRINGVRNNLILSFTDENPKGKIIGASTIYNSSTTETNPKINTTLKQGDRIDLLCEYIEGNKKSLKVFGNMLSYSKDMKISDVKIGDNKMIRTYHITDLYNHSHYTQSY